MDAPNPSPVWPPKQCRRTAVRRNHSHEVPVYGYLRVTDDRKDDEARDMDPLTMAPRWALSPLDWHAHAIDTWADHPLGLWIARCGHRLLGGTSLHDTPPGQRCPACARWSPTLTTGDGP
jgi:hypothetical protein